MSDNTIIIVDSQTVADQPFDLPFQINTHILSENLEPAEKQKQVFRAAISMIVISVSEISNPPIVVALNKGHKLLSMAFSFAISTTLMMGVLLLVFSMLLQRTPGIEPLAEKMVLVGKVLVKVTLAFGSSLVLMVASSSWLVLFLVFIGSLYM